MKIIRSPDKGRQYMLRPNFELSHLRDVLPSKDVEPHKHDFYEIYFINSGIISYTVEGKVYKLRPEDILLINRYDLHGPKLDKTAVYDRILLWISREYLQELSTPDTDLSTCFKQAWGCGRNLLRLNQEALGQFKETLAKLERAYFSSNFGDDIKLRCYFSELLVLLNRIFLNIPEEDVEDDIKTNKLIDEVLVYINENLEKDLTLDALAEEFYISKYYLLRKFKKNMGYTIYQYILLKRLHLAEKFLSENVSVMETAFRCGFKSYSTFLRTFTKHYGTTPWRFSQKN